MTRPLFCFCAAFALGCIASQYFLAPALWLPAAGIVLVLGALGLLLRGPMRRRVLLCALGMAFAFGWSAAYARFIAAPNEALIGATEDVELELCSYAVETNYGAKATVRILGRGLRGRAVYYGGFDLLALEPGERVRDTVLFNSATDPSGDGSHIRNFTSKGVYLLLYSRGEPSYETGDAGALRYAPQRIAKKLGETIETVYGEREGGFLRALLLGDKRYLDVEDSSNLSEAGIYHITAVSGLHCMFLVELLDRLLRASHRRIRCAVTIPLLFLYAVMVGASPSILRACVMLSMTQLAPLFRREKDPPTALGLALLLILLKNPYAIASISLQLSFSAVAGLVWLDFSIATKGTGLAEMCGALGVSPEETAAFGDNWNDQAMLDMAGRCYLMEQADGALRRTLADSRAAAVREAPRSCRDVCNELEAILSCAQ